MDRRKFIQTGVAGIAGFIFSPYGLADIQVTVSSDVSVDR